jgi:hypothetical protein
MSMIGSTLGKSFTKGDHAITDFARRDAPRTELDQSIIDSNKRGRARANETRRLRRALEDLV